MSATTEFLYRLKSADGTLLYVGITTDWPNRFKQHQTDKPWWSEVASIELVRLTCTRSQVEAIERAVIKAEQPVYNVVHNTEKRRTLAAPITPVRLTPSPLGTDWIRQAMIVDHPTFGRGVVVEIRGEGDRSEATIRFDRVGTKHLSVAWAPLKPAGVDAYPDSFGADW